MIRNQNDAGWKEANDAGLKIWTTALENAVDAGAWFSDIRGTSASDIWAVGTNGLVAHFTNGKWDLVDVGAGKANLYGVWPVSTTEVWVAGGVPGTASTADQPKLFRLSGTTWKSIDVPSDAGILYRPWTENSACGVWLAGTTGILRYSP